jgi:hypothetical protein
MSLLLKEAFVGFWGDSRWNNNNSIGGMPLF